MTTRHVILGAGPVGRSIADHLLHAHGTVPTVVTRSGTTIDGAAAKAADLSDGDSAKRALAGADVVYQCAQPAYNRWPAEFPALQDCIVEAVAATGAVLVATENMYGYGPVTGPMSEDLALVATTRKGAVRARLWLQLERAHERGDLQVVAARASDFYGPGVEASAFGSRLFGPVVAGGKAEALGDPSTLHTITYVPDLARAMVRLGAAPESWGRAWHVPNAPARTSNDIIAMAAQAAGTEPRISTLGPLKMRLAGLFVPAAREMIELGYEFDRDFVVDDTAYIDRFGPEHTPLETGIASTVAWYKGRSG